MEDLGLDERIILELILGK